MTGIFCGKPYDFNKERELILSAKEKINKIAGLKEKLSDHLFDGETKVSKLLNDLEYEKIETLHNITELESKLEKLGMSHERIDRIKNSVL